MAGKRQPQGKTDDRATLGRRHEGALFPTAPRSAGLPDDYADALGEIKRRIKEERLRAVLSVNSTMVLL